MSEGPDEGPELTGSLVPLFVITEGRALPPDHEYDHTTLVTAQNAPAVAARTLSPEARKVTDLVADGFLSLAEVSAHTRLPLGIVRILVAQLDNDGLLLVRKPIPRAERVDRELLSAVLDGLRNQFGA
ncbi:DUF742 domain-containing protein [Streptomyces griseoviridis]|jgi:hypothetical protein|uniref:DUF742 domain-containing protein n=3 Tax=Streptomyces TaxID=1883 RepID=A0ABT9LM58_STRGD|nr:MULTISPECIES: DUF742 domain-containing protein [Streptomyces]MDP9684622.1 hypothetical protein [Streptomyces griseoviridis]GGS63915.1 hypothetical protein GCM10010238_61220 [Streptomyces niveoruber]GGT20947.1 hypothetical protein GCM10010240_62260 [Streptomyces griseoviridis]GGU61862.1 hypothetical protein GCM10010259_60670 [Streptomyces daghestanicus]GHI30422.1 hypothetical protein Sdagh_21520 [Streptomyces daghestanicus]